MIEMTTDERRKETRFRSRGPVRLVVAGGVPIPGTVYDVSESGISAEVEAEIRPGTVVRIEGEGWEGSGVVRHCTRRADVCLIGLATEKD